MYKELFQKILKRESDALSIAAARIDESAEEAISMLLTCTGKVIVCGLGKSGLIAAKIAATLNSTGTRAVYLHAGEAFHGDLAVCAPGDIALLLSKSGTTVELARLMPHLKTFEVKTIGILGNLGSQLAAQCDVVIDASVEFEADGEHVVPTSSSTLALAIGDAIALTLMKTKNFGPDDFARFHPGGQLGKNLMYRVRDLMHLPEKVARVKPSTPLKEVIIKMTELPLGAACVETAHKFVGIITDGDIRRSLLTHDDIRDIEAKDVMTSNPVSISPSENIIQAIVLMENRESQISILPVLEEGKLAGVIRIHDVY